MLPARWTVVRGALASFGSARPGATAIVLAIAACPTWTIGIALGINRALDRSPLVAHEWRVLEWQRPAKGRARCLVTSWREHATEVLSDAVVQPGAPDGQGRSEGALKDGTPVVYGVAGPGRWPHGAKDGAHTILDVAVLHAELRDGLTRWFEDLEAGKDAEASHVDRNLPSLVIVKPARVEALAALSFGGTLVAVVNVTK